jgi:disulfide oxidoreductase YuzD
MELIYSAIIAALGKLGEHTIKDGYEALKALIKRKFGQKQDLNEAIQKIEDKPDSPGRQATLKEEITAAKVDQDEEIVKAAVALLERLKAVPGGQQIIQQTVTGDKNIFSGTGDVTVAFGHKKD